MNYKANINLLALRDAVMCSMPGPDGIPINGIFIPQQKNDAYIGFKSEKQPDGTWKQVLDANGHQIPNRFSISVNVWENSEAYRDKCANNPINQGNAEYIAPTHKVILNLRKEHRERLLKQFEQQLSKQPSFLSQHPNPTQADIEQAARNAFEKLYKLADLTPTYRENEYKAPTATFGAYHPDPTPPQTSPSPQTSPFPSTPTLDKLNTLFDNAPTPPPPSQPPLDLSPDFPDDDLPF